jgi:hypothetical protein
MSIKCHIIHSGYNSLSCEISKAGYLNTPLPSLILLLLNQCFSNCVPRRSAGGFGRKRIEKILIRQLRNYK